MPVDVFAHAQSVLVEAISNKSRGLCIVSQTESIFWVKSLGERLHPLLPEYLRTIGSIDPLFVEPVSSTHTLKQ